MLLSRHFLCYWEEWHLIVYLRVIIVFSDTASITDQSCQDQSIRSQSPQPGKEKRQEDKVDSGGTEEGKTVSETPQTVADEDHLSPVPTPVADFLHNAGLSDHDSSAEDRSDTETEKDGADDKVCVCVCVCVCVTHMP